MGKIKSIITGAMLFAAAIYAAPSLVAVCPGGRCPSAYSNYGQCQPSGCKWTNDTNRQCRGSCQPGQPGYPQVQPYNQQYNLPQQGRQSQGQFQYNGNYQNQQGQDRPSQQGQYQYNGNYQYQQEQERPLPRLRNQ